MKTNRFLMLLKTRGPLTATEIAKELNITTEGARLQLLKLTEEGLIQSVNESKGVGRPTQYFSLTELGNKGFPDTHAELTVKLIQLMKETLGEEALQSVISAGEERAKQRYQQQLNQNHSLEERIKTLAEIRSREGYMAEYSKDDKGYLLVENHCPICAAAKICQGFCTSELNTFKFILGNDVSVTRVNHIIAGDRRCAYRIVPVGY
ncbi:putative ArsR family transcriptional regulator [Pedobacter africanus]|uniref:ArsR family transcriptional regulator n=1 Tax=Pedobacter africanus TaxID=151894 RepID=A0ACC6KVN1_9SPHI|nr:metalloregulator ArsR/SmtB family transcription factor [Pedobacter africanus]MDR6783430.1 putative ArsR family transcriptional regulator [Pedobacter africanus]